MLESSYSQRILSQIFNAPYRDNKNLDMALLFLFSSGTLSGLFFVILDFNIRNLTSQLHE